MTKTIGFLGDGDVSERKTRALLNDQLDAHDNLRFILPITDEHFTDRVATVAEWALKNDIPVEVITTDSTDELLKSKTRDKALAKEILDVAVKEHKVTRVPHKLVSLLAEAKVPGELYLFWDESDDAYKALDRGGEAGVRAFDMTNGLEELELGDEEEGAESSEVEPEEDEETTPLPDDERAEAMESLPTREEMEAMDLEEVQEIAGKLGIEFPKRTRKNTYITAILEKAGAEEEPSELEDEEAEVPQGEEEVETLVEEPEDETEAVVHPEDVEEPEEELVASPPADNVVPLQIDAKTGEVTGRGPWVYTTVILIPEDSDGAHVIGACAACGGPYVLAGKFVNQVHAPNCELAR